MTEAEKLDDLYRQVRRLRHTDEVPDDIQSEIRMLFNEALAGGPNMNGDAGPTLTVNHAIDCIWATKRIAELTRAASQGEHHMREEKRS